MKPLLQWRATRTLSPDELNAGWSTQPTTAFGFSANLSWTGSTPPLGPPRSPTNGRTPARPLIVSLPSLLSCLLPQHHGGAAHQRAPLSGQRIPRGSQRKRSASPFTDRQASTDPSRRQPATTSMFTRTPTTPCMWRRNCPKWLAGESWTCPLTRTSSKPWKPQVTTTSFSTLRRPVAKKRSRRINVI